MKNHQAVKNYFVLPCCLLLLNLCVEIVSYKTKMLDDALLRTAAIMGMVLFGGSFVGFVVSPAISAVVFGMQRRTRQGAGELGELFFLLGLGALVFWLYYRVYTLGPQSILPVSWRNHR